MANNPAPMNSTSTQNNYSSPFSSQGIYNCSHVYQKQNIFHIEHLSLNNQTKTPNTMATNSTSWDSSSTQNKSSSSPSPSPSSVSIPSTEEVEQVVNSFDTYSDGGICATELGAILSPLGSSSSSSDELRRQIKDVLRSNFADGEISVKEHVDDFSSLGFSFSDKDEIRRRIKDKLREDFRLLDQDQNGLISASELHLVLTHLGMNCSVEDCHRMIRCVDSDGGGNVNFEEFQKMMTTASPL